MGLLQARLAFGNGLRNWHTPPADQGQVVDKAYTCDEKYTYVRRIDRCDGSVTIEAYHGSPDEWEPWNKAPVLGDRIGVVYNSRSTGNGWHGEAFNIGQYARIAQIRRDANPFPKGSDERAEWFLGYDIG